MRLNLLAYIVAFAAMIGIAGHAMADSEGRIELSNMAAKVIIITQARDDIEVKVRPGTKALPQITISRNGRTVRVNGHMPNRQPSCGSNGGIFAFNFDDKKTASVKVTGMSPLNLSDLPTVYIYAPRRLEVMSFGAIYGSINESQALKLHVFGCGDWKIGPVIDTLHLISTGNGDIMAAHAGRTEVTSAGTGDIIIGPVRSLKTSQSGSGDVVTGPIAEGLSAAVAGSGDLAIASVNGAVEISVAGSGDVAIARGRANTLKVALAGSGDVYFGGEALQADAAIVGSGDIHIGRVRGTINKKVLGSGEVNIGH